MATAGCLQAKVSRHITICMPFNGERNLTACVIQFKQYSSPNNFMSRTDAKTFTVYSTIMQITCSLVIVRCMLFPVDRDYVRAVSTSIPKGSCPLGRNPGGSKSVHLVKCNLSPLTRKLPFAQVLGFALLAARHVGQWWLSAQFTLGDPFLQGRLQ